MATSLKRIYWDSCSWIALISNERIYNNEVLTENRGADCRAVIRSAVKGEIELFTSALGLVEVNKGSLVDGGVTVDKIKDFFENEYIIIVSLDRQVGELGRELMQRGYSKLKPADASHIAAAAVAAVDEMHTYDDKLLALNGKVAKADGTMLRICKPAMTGPKLPLLDR